MDHASDFGPCVVDIETCGLSNAADYLEPVTPAKNLKDPEKIANARGCDYSVLAPIVPDSGRLAEVWFTEIKPGDTPENSQTAKLAYEWINDWHQRMQSAFAQP